MATTFFIRTTQKSGKTKLFARLQLKQLNLDLRASTQIEVDIKRWQAIKGSKVAENNFYRDFPNVKADTNKVINEIDALTNSGAKPITSEQFRAAINSALTREIKAKQEEEKKKEAEKLAAKAKADAEAKRITLSKFIVSYLDDITTGRRQTPNGRRYAYNSIKSTKQSFTKLKEYQRDKKKVLDFNDIDLEFYNDFSAYLRQQDYSVNTIGKVFKDIKTIMQAALSEELHTNFKFQDKTFKASKVEVDSIYLTKKDLDAIMAADLSKLDKCYAVARDIFLIGVYTAQRVSDYNHINKDSIKTSTIKVIVDDKIVEKTIYTIRIIQQKTKKEVIIPVKSELLEILRKYDFKVPHMQDQKINEYIKKVGEVAGLTEQVEIITTKGGRPNKESLPKYSLIHTHTARRTGATLMYLDGMEIYDIMQITGHSSPKTLEKYIKANALQVAEKIASKYDYFN